MGMKQKLDKAFEAGFAEGQKSVNRSAFLQGQIEGSKETWIFMEEMFLEIDGIGPKTRDKLIRKIKQYANKEANK